MAAFEKAVAAFERIHAEDPTAEAGVSVENIPAVVYHRRLLHWVDALDANASEALRLAAACQHIRRWQKRRDEFAPGPVGYKRWRSQLAIFHGEVAEGILREVGYDETTIGRVRALLQKKGLRSDVEVQCFENAICLTFLECEFQAFAAKHPDDKVVDILQKTWAKMTEPGHDRARQMAGSLPPALRALFERAAP